MSTWIVIYQLVIVETEAENGDGMLHESSKPPFDDKGNAAFCLTLPGKKLYIQPLLATTKR